MSKMICVKCFQRYNDIVLHLNVSHFKYGNETRSAVMTHSKRSKRPTRILKNQTSTNLAKIRNPSEIKVLEILVGVEI